MLDRIDEAIADPRAGRPVIVVDDEDRENEGDLIMAAGLATASTLAFFVRWTSGLLHAPISAEVAERLLLPPMVADSQDPAGTAYPVSADARDGIESGISAADRALTARLLADPATRPDQLRRPGHLFPVRARPGGLAERRDHTEAGWYDEESFYAEARQWVLLLQLDETTHMSWGDGAHHLGRPPGPPRCPRLLQDPLRRPGPLTSSAESYKAHVESGPIAHSCPDFPRRSPA
ncbi:3,4-dihydroxy-2-butanone-4-phosphate synthase [Nonomuraea sp. NPDC050328]|uniref:3,4-dihydroxy-2-butanone-4-phosphate synthase n=1 Tax=Nonomuraea sp. NPDC050328 TaxID=3364361 RepID=UPI003790D572